MDRPVTIHEMENIIGAVDAADFSMAGDIGGNIIEISDSNDALGLGMLANPGRQRGGSGSGGGGGGGGGGESSSAPAFGGGFGGGLAEVEIGGLDTVEPITLNLGGGGMGSSGGSPPPMEFEIKRGGGGGGGAFDSTPFSNTQTATGPSYGLSAAQSPMRLSQEEERAKKIDYLNKLQRLEQKDFQMSKRFTMDNTLDEMKQEYDRLVDARNLSASLRFQRQALMSVVTGLEWVNGRFDPFDLKLDGWSESVHEKLDNEEFDDIFEELYDKYKERGKMPPEARLVMSLAGSGFMIHVSNTFLKSKMSNISAEDILKNNPDLARQFATAAANQAGGGFGNFMNMAMGGAGGAGPAAQAAPVGAGAMYDSSARAAAQAAAEAKARAAAEMAFQQQSRGNGGAPMAQVPQSVAAMEPPRATARREMRGPTGVDDILRQFEEARRDEAMDGSAAFPSAMPTAMQQPATVAAIEIQSMASGDDIGSAAESTRTGRGGGRRRRAPVGNVMSLEL